MYETFVWWNYIYAVNTFCQKCYEHKTIFERDNFEKPDKMRFYSIMIPLEKAAMLWIFFMKDCNEGVSCLSKVFKK